MAHSLPRIKIPEASGITVDPDACAAFMREYGMSDDQIPLLTIRADPGTPRDKILPPAHFYQVELTSPLYLRHHVYEDKGQTLVLYPNNIRSQLRADLYAPSRYVAEGLSMAVDYAALGVDGIIRDRERVLRRAYVRGTVKPGLGAAALGAAEGTLFYLNDKLNLELPMPIALLGVLAFGAAVAGIPTMGAAARSRQVKEKAAFRSWPEQTRARERAQAYAQQVEAGEKLPLATINRTL